VDPTSEIAARSAALEGEPSLAAELGIAVAVEQILEEVKTSQPAIAHIRLSSTATDEWRGNPVFLRGLHARSVAVWNANAFSVYFGAGPGSGDASSALLTIPASKLVVLPVEDNVFCVGTAAGNISGAEAPLIVVRFSTVQAFAVYALV
jgi:hypothetical protein